MRFVLTSLIIYTAIMACSGENTYSNMSDIDSLNGNTMDSNIHENESGNGTWSDSDSSPGLTRRAENENLELIEKDDGTFIESSSHDLDSVNTKEMEIITTVSPLDLNYDASYGGTLKFTSEYTDYELSYQNVHLQFSPTHSSFGPGIIYSRILKFKTGPEVIQPSLELECDLCESWQMTSPTRFKFKLKEGVKWHNHDLLNDKVLRSRHVIDSIELQLTGLNSLLIGSVSDISIIDDLEFYIDLKVPDADFMIGLADARSRIVNTELSNLEQATRSGTGPWQITNDGNRGVYKFEKNPVYFDKHLPYADNLNLYIIPDEITRQTAFVVGSLDAIHLNDSQLREFESKFDEMDYFRVSETGIGMEISLNSNRYPFNDINVRKAFYSAIDPLSYIDEIWSGAGYVSLGMPLINNDWMIKPEETSRHFSNINKAKNLLNELEIAPLTIKVGQFGQGYIESAERLQQDLSRVGIQSKIDQVSRIDFVDKVWKDGDYELFLGPAPYVNSPNIYLFSIIHSGGAWSHGNPFSEELDSLIEAQSVEYDNSKRKLQHQRIQDLIWESFTRFMPVTSKSTWVVNDSLKNFYPTLAGFEYNYLSEAWLDTNS
jgi:peptide/nickel transport system substrate-binding protein